MVKDIARSLLHMRHRPITFRVLVQIVGFRECSVVIARPITVSSSLTEHNESLQVQGMKIGSLRSNLNGCLAKIFLPSLFLSKLDNCKTQDIVSPDCKRKKAELTNKKNIAMTDCLVILHTA